MGGKKLLNISENSAEPSISENQVVKETFLKTIKPLTRNGASIFYLAHTPKKTAEPSTKAGAKNSSENAELFERVELCEYSIDNIQEKIAKIDEFSKKLDSIECDIFSISECVEGDITSISESIADTDELLNTRLDKLENMLNLLEICLDKQGLQIHKQSKQDEKNQEFLVDHENRLLEIEMNDLITISKRLDKLEKAFNDSIALSNAEFLAINERFEALESADYCEISAKQDQAPKAEKSRFLGLF